MKNPLITLLTMIVLAAAVTFLTSCSALNCKPGAIQCPQKTEAKAKTRIIPCDTDTDCMRKNGGDGYSI